MRLGLDLEPAPGLLAGLTYPLWPDVEGFTSPLYTLLVSHLARDGWEVRGRWLRVTGVDALVTHAVPRPLPADLALLDRVSRDGADTFLWAVRDAAPPAWWPRRLVAARGPLSALEAVGRLPDPVATAVVPQVVPQDRDGAVRLLRAAPDRLELAVRSRDGGVAVVQRTYHPLLRARSDDGRALSTFPADLTLLGVLVPPGEHRVTVSVSGWPEALAGALAAAVALAALAAAAWRGRTPAR